MDPVLRENKMLRGYRVKAAAWCLVFTLAVCVRLNAQDPGQTTGSTSTSGSYGKNGNNGKPSSPNSPAAPGQREGPSKPPTGKPVPAQQVPSTKGGHGPVTERGQQPHGSSNSGEIAAAAVGAAATAIVLTEIFSHRPPSPGKLGEEGPKVPDAMDMSSFTVTGLAKANWPVAVDFAIDQPGKVLLEIHQGKDRPFYKALTNKVNSRGIAIFNLPDQFSSDLQTTVFQVHFISAAGVDPAPGMRMYGMGVGERAVGSVSIDQLTFQPAVVHPKAKEVATYSFHAHSAFDGAEAGFMFTTMDNGHVLVQKDEGKRLPPIGEGERGSNVWDGHKGKPGDHQLRMRAWRGLQNGGDWVVAWSPDIVDLVE